MAEPMTIGEEKTNAGNGLCVQEELHQVVFIAAYCRI